MTYLHQAIRTGFGMVEILPLDIPNIFVVMYFYVVFTPWLHLMKNVYDTSIQIYDEDRAQFLRCFVLTSSTLPLMTCIEPPNMSPSFEIRVLNECFALLI